VNDIRYPAMDDEAKELLREIRDLQKEELTLYRKWNEQSSELIALQKENYVTWKQNQLEWQARNRRSNKWVLIVFGGWALVMLAYLIVTIVKGRHS
jgi:hypothetical protein